MFSSVTLKMFFTDTVLTEKLLAARQLNLYTPL